MVTTLGGCGCCSCSLCDDGMVSSSVAGEIANGVDATATIDGSTETTSPISNLNGSRTFDIIYFNGNYKTGYDTSANGVVQGSFGGDGCITVYEWTLSSFGDIFTGTSGFGDEAKWLRNTRVRLRIYVEFLPISVSGLTQDLLLVYVYSVYLDDTPSPDEWAESLVWQGQAPAPDAESGTTIYDWFCDCTAAVEALIYSAAPGLEGVAIIAYSTTGDTHNGATTWGTQAYTVMANALATAYAATEPDPITVLGSCDKISVVP